MLERTFHWISDLRKSFLTFLKILVRSDLFLKKDFPKASAEACIILGNGPSLKKVLADYSPETLRKYPLFCVNKFPDTEHYEKLKPPHFVIASSQYFEKNTTDPNTEIRQGVLKALVQNTSWDLTMFCPAGAKKNKDFIQSIHSNQHIKLVFYNNTPIEGLPRINRFFMNLGWGSPRPHNVLIPSILMAIRSGFKKIYLVGADHSWLPMITVTNKNIALVNRKHFYDETTAKEELMLKEGKRPRRLDEVLEKFMFTFRSYFELKSFADFKNSKVINCTTGSFIDAFERKPLEDIFV